MQHVDEVATGKGRGTVTAYQFDADESMVARKRDASVTRIEQVEPFMVGQRVRDKRCSPCCPGSDSVSSPRTDYCPGGSQRTEGAAMEPHPAVASEKHVVLHGFGWDNLCSYGE